MVCAINENCGLLDRGIVVAGWKRHEIRDRPLSGGIIGGLILPRNDDQSLRPWSHLEDHLTLAWWKQVLSFFLPVGALHDWWSSPPPPQPPPPAAAAEGANYLPGGQKVILLQLHSSKAGISVFRAASPRVMRAALPCHAVGTLGPAKSGCPRGLAGKRDTRNSKFDFAPRSSSQVCSFPSLYCVVIGRRRRGVPKFVYWTGLFER